MKKFATFLFALVAGLVVTASAFANGHNNVAFAFRGNGHNNVSFAFNGYHNNAFAVRAFTFSSPVYARADAYFTYTPFSLVALPPVAQVQYQTDPCQPVAQVAYQAPAQVTYAAPQVTYAAAPSYSYGFFGVNPGYSVGSYGSNFGVRRFAAFENHGHNALVRVDVNRFQFRGDFRGRDVVQETRVFRGPLGGRVERTTTRVRGR